jgi:hypothetical protein
MQTFFILKTSEMWESAISPSEEAERAAGRQQPANRWDGTGGQIIELNRLLQSCQGRSVTTA